MLLSSYMCVYSNIYKCVRACARDGIIAGIGDGGFFKLVVAMCIRRAEWSVRDCYELRVEIVRSRNDCARIYLSLTRADRGNGLIVVFVKKSTRETWLIMIARR